MAAKKRGRPRKSPPASPDDTPNKEPVQKPSAKKKLTKKKTSKKIEKKAKKYLTKLDDPVSMWTEAHELSAHISDHYSMLESERMLAFAYALTLPKKATMVEIGVTHGKTASLLAYVADRMNFTYVGIDNFTVEGNAAQFRETFDALGYPYTLLEGDSGSVKFHKKIDYLLVDGGHDLNNIRVDCERWLRYIRPGGLVLFHEYVKKMEVGDPHWYVKYFADKYTKHWIQEDYVPNLMVRRKPIE